MLHAYDFVVSTINLNKLLTSELQISNLVSDVGHAEHPYMTLSRCMLIFIILMQM